MREAAPHSISWPFLIRGLTRAGATFRPSDWAERLADVTVLFVGERRADLHSTAARFAMPVIDEGVKCLAVAHDLADVCPDALAFLVQFAQDNDLRIEPQMD
ncbi:DUF3579 domain-containing protein [Trinickia sp. LjRoot230]|uniref:DUF3579 domain-containing protein n=1 Tax=Trinickia sp. LjRoot230 TaxID=3342288 RepID=UPI003ECEB794